MKHIHIGIDPGIKNGFAAWDPNGKQFEEVATIPLWELFFKLAEYITRTQVTVWIENPNTWVPFKNKVLQTARLQGAGAVKQTYKHIIEWLQNHHVTYHPCRLQGGLKKTTSEFFKRQTKWNKPTSEHARDAAFLVWNRA